MEAACSSESCCPPVRLHAIISDMLLPCSYIILGSATLITHCTEHLQALDPMFLRNISTSLPDHTLKPRISQSESSQLWKPQISYFSYSFLNAFQKAIDGHVLLQRLQD